MTGAVVVGVDGSQNSVQALEWSVAEAELRGTELLIVYCLHMPIATATFAESVTVPQVDALKDYADGVLSAVADTARQMAPDLQVNTTLAVRPPAAGLVEVSADASLIVVGTRGLSGLGAVFLGSVSTRVSASAPCPTVVVPANGADRGLGGPIVVGIDGSDHSDAALRFALQAAALRDAEVIALYGRGPTDGLHLPDTVERTEQAQAEAIIAEALDRAGAADSPSVTTHVATADAADALLEAGQEAVLTVVGSRGRGGFRGMLLGSVSQSVLHGADHPVAVVQAGYLTST